MVIRVIEKVLHDVTLGYHPHSTHFLKVQLQASAAPIKLLFGEAEGETQSTLHKKLWIQKQYHVQAKETIISIMSKNCQVKVMDSYITEE